MVRQKHYHYRKISPLEEDQELLDEEGKENVAYDSPVRNHRPVRNRRPPKWLHDYYADK